jgi:hypothetical protein
MAERVAIFVDGSNFYHALKDNFGRADLDFGVLASKLCGERHYQEGIISASAAGLRPLNYLGVFSRNAG